MRYPWGVMLASCLLHLADMEPQLRAQPPEGKLTVVLPDGKTAEVEETVPTDELIDIKIETTAKKVVWVLPDGVRSRVDSSGRAVTLLFRNQSTESYRVVAVVIAGDDGVTVERRIKAGPKGPAPPVDEFVKELQAAFDASPANEKADKIKLATLYEKLADQINQLNTVEQVATAIQTASDLQMKTSLQNVRKVCGRTFGKVLPTDAATVLTNDQKFAAAESLRRMAKIIRELKETN